MKNTIRLRALPEDAAYIRNQVVKDVQRKFVEFSGIALTDAQLVHKLVQHWKGEI